MLYLTSFSYIDFVPYIHFKTKHNLYLNEHKVQNQYMKETLSKAFDTKQTTQIFLVNIKKII